jgi:spore germination cell wall hydrolase CwlJ-like protein
METPRQIVFCHEPKQRGGDMMIIKSTLFCLALNGYRETRGESIAAQIAAMKILQNRATLNRTHVCEEVAKHKQFAWVRKYGVKNPNPRGELDKAAWKQAQQLAKSVDEINVAGISKKHIYFNTLALGRRYQTKTKSKKIGGLLFY